VYLGQFGDLVFWRLMNTSVMTNLRVATVITFQLVTSWLVEHKKLDWSRSDLLEMDSAFLMFSTCTIVSHLCSAAIHYNSSSVSWLRKPSRCGFIFEFVWSSTGICNH
jgi:hypothetical protein